MIEKFLKQLPYTNRNVVVLLSGGIDSIIVTRVFIEKYGKEKIHCLSINFEDIVDGPMIQHAKNATAILGVHHETLNINLWKRENTFMYQNKFEMPRSYYPGRILVMNSLAYAYAETYNCALIAKGTNHEDNFPTMLQPHPWPRTSFLERMNEFVSDRKDADIKYYAPFSNITKKQEVQLLLELDGNIDLLKHSLSCEFTDVEGKSCGTCYSCQDRLNALHELGLEDVIPYQNKN